MSNLNFIPPQNPCHDEWQPARKIGYVVANNNQEFVVSASDGLCVWTSNPAHARCFPSVAAVRVFLKALRYPNQLWPLMLFETEHQFAVGTTAKNRPAWLPQTELMEQR